MKNKKYHVHGGKTDEEIILTEGIIADFFKSLKRKYPISDFAEYRKLMVAIEQAAIERINQ